MARKINLEERITNITELGYTILNYSKNSSGEINYHIKCNTCGSEFKKTYSVLMKGCTGCKPKKKPKVHTEPYYIRIQKHIESQPNLRWLNPTDHVKYNTVIKVECLKHNKVYEKQASRILEQQYNCKECSNEVRLDAVRRNNYVNFIKQSKEKFKDKFTYYPFEESNYKTNQSHVKLFCNKHNIEFECEASSHLLSNTGACPICFKEDRYCFVRNPLMSEVKSLEDLQRVSDEKFGHYTILSYTSKYAKCKIKCNKHNIEFEVSPYYHIDSKSGACPSCVDEINVGFTKISQTQIDISNMVKELISEDEVVDNVKILKNPKKKNSVSEIDIYVPNYNFGIEYHGILWHSYGIDKSTMLNNFDELDKNKHALKADLSEQQNIQLFQIYEDEWLDHIKRRIWTSMIKLKLNKIENKIPARKCEIREINDHKLIGEFLETNHIQGYVYSKVNIGLFYNDELVSLMTFGDPRCDNCEKYQYELLRFCSKLNTIVIRGVSKLFNYFIKTYNPKSIISYANRRWSHGDIYLQLGFTKVDKPIKPNYDYVNVNKMERYSSSKYQKHMLEDKLENFDPNLSEHENMVNNGFRILYDAGNYTFEWIQSDLKNK